MYTEVKSFKLERNDLIRIFNDAMFCYVLFSYFDTIDIVMEFEKNETEANNSITESELFADWLLKGGELAMQDVSGIRKNLIRFSLDDMDRKLTEAILLDKDFRNELKKFNNKETPNKFADKFFKMM